MKVTKILNIVAISLIASAFLCLMLSYLTNVFFYFTLVLGFLGCGLLSYVLLDKYIRQRKVESQKQEAIIMELAEGEDGEKYVMKDSKQTKKQRAKAFHASIDKLLPFLFSATVTIILFALIISSIVALF
ncbi:MAG: hypothetical protein IJX26_01110 [Clostridia bacterium]|nr:hypothetical protein [Clostridia bacterium]